jgi:endo-1,4-beta-xylanase
MYYMYILSVSLIKIKETKIKALRKYLICLFVSLAGAGDRIEAQIQPVLKEVFKNDFMIGAALNDLIVSGKDQRASDIVQNQFNTITPENVMKWQLIHPEGGRYDFNAADRFVEYGIKHKMFIVGHTLVWHWQTPSGLFTDSSGKLLDRQTMLDRMKEHIFTVVGRYKGKVKGWDVVNEALSDSGTISRTGWVETIGEDFIEKAFEFAHEADPDAELYYNDFLIDRPVKRDGTIRLVRKLQSKGLRIDGVGLQWHCGLDYPERGEFSAFVDSISALGVKIMITEMDVDILPSASQYRGADIGMRAKLKEELNPYKDGLPAEKQKQLAYRYAELFSMLLDKPGKISRVTFWGVSDGASWLNNWPIRDRTNYPLLFDRNYKPKPAFYSVVQTGGRKK